MIFAWSMVIGLIVAIITYCILKKFVGFGEDVIGALISFFIVLIIGVIGLMITDEIDERKEFKLGNSAYEITIDDYVRIKKAETNCNPEEILDTEKFNAYVTDMYGHRISEAEVTDRTVYIKDSKGKPYLVVGRLYHNLYKYDVLEVHY